VSDPAIQSPCDELMVLSDGNLISERFPERFVAGEADKRSKDDKTRRDHERKSEMDIDRIVVYSKAF
jgi:hypothetical protein